MPASFVLLEVFSRPCYFWFMSERLYSRSCPECGGVCPLQARVCKYCNFFFPGRRTFSLNWRAARVVAIPTEVAEKVRTTLRAPVYGFPAHAELATDDAPCRHCLRIIVANKHRRILFTYDRFAGVESLPQPGPVNVHD